MLFRSKTEADRKQDEADKRAPGRDADQPKKPPKPPIKKAGGGSIYARGAKVSGASHMDHSDHIRKHHGVGGFMHHDDHVKKMCGGGYMKGKK